VPQHDLLISGGHVVTLDPRIGDLPRGDVLIRNARSPLSGLVPHHVRRARGWWRPAADW
jgi:hypothetical protein